MIRNINGRLLYSLSILLIGVLLGACKKQPSNSSSGISSPDSSSEISSSGMLEGTVGVYEGNCMPSPTKPPCEPRPIEATVYVSKPIKEFEKALVLDSVQSNSEGKYSISLPAGKYSLFLKADGEITCSQLNCPSDCYCSLITIESGSRISKDLTIDRATW